MSNFALPVNLELFTGTTAVRGLDWRWPPGGGFLWPVPAAQILLLPDARPLVDRLGVSFFRTLPTHPGVYLLRDETDAILYVGKARNLRQRLGHYRVANPDRLPRRLLRLLHRARRIEWQSCPDEAAALARERELLLALRPRFNRAGVWPASPKFLAWRTTEAGLEFSVLDGPAAGWSCHGTGGAVRLRVVLVRVLWLALRPGEGMGGMPLGWYAGHLPECALLPCAESQRTEGVADRLRALLAGDMAGFTEWLPTLLPETHAFDRLAVAADLEQLTELLRPRTAP